MTSPLSSHQQSDFQKLRKLLIGEVAISKLDSLSQDEIAYISNLISEAISARHYKDSSLSEALAPIVDCAFDRSIRKDPHKIADVFYPIIGPAIRKSVSSALFDMVQSLNQLLEQSLSIKSLIWRFKAWKSGKSYAEYALLKTLKYRVEQVFLIHKESGVLINSAVAPEVVTQDPDLVSSMLTAINDFTSDSFETNNQSLEWLKFGDLTLHIQVGPKAIIAVAVRGSSGKKVTEMLNTTLESIHESYYSLLDDFDGDKDQWQFISPTIENCLISKTNISKKKKSPWFALIIIAIGLTYFASYLYKNFQLHDQRTQVIKFLKNNTNYFHISDKLNGDIFKLRLIKDQKEISFKEVLKKLNLSSLKVEVEEISLPLNEPQNLVPYIHSLTDSPSTLLIEIIQNTLVLSGHTSSKQLATITHNNFLKNKFESIDSHRVTIIENKDEHQIKSEMLKQLRNEISGRYFIYEKSAKQLTNHQLVEFGQTIKQLKQMYLLSAELEKPIQQISLVGHSDKTGTKTNNERLSLERAGNLKELLIANNLPPNDIIISGIGYTDRDKLNTAQQRRVTIMVYYNED